MLYLILAVLCSASITLALRMFGSQNGSRYGLILGNYLTCVAISLAMTGGAARPAGMSGVTLLCGLISGVLYVAGLLTMQSSIRVNGATLTAAFSRLGMLVTLAVSVLCFGERPSAAQCVGAGLAVASLVLIHAPAQPSNTAQSARTGSLALLIITLLAGGCSDAMSKVYERVGPRTEDTLYFTLLFLTAAVITFILSIREKRRTGHSIRLPELAAGVVVGIPNYFSSYLLLKALTQLPAVVVYPAWSTGTILTVMACSAALFRERPGRRQLAGLAVIVCALGLLSL